MTGLDPVIHDKPQTPIPKINQHFSKAAERPRARHAMQKKQAPERFSASNLANQRARGKKPHKPRKRQSQIRNRARIRHRQRSRLQQRTTQLAHQSRSNHATPKNLPINPPRQRRPSLVQTTRPRLPNKNKRRPKNLRPTRHTTKPLTRTNDPTHANPVMTGPDPVIHDEPKTPDAKTNPRIPRV